MPDASPRSIRTGHDLLLVLLPQVHGRRSHPAGRDLKSLPKPTAATARLPSRGETRGHKMMRAVLALLCLLEGATCRVTERDGRVPPSKKIKKVDCGGWNHPDSEENTRKTVYGKIGWACMAEYGEKGEIREDQTLIDVGIGTGFDDDRPVRDDVYETRYADPYVCWNKHLYKATWDGTSSLHTFFQLGFSS